MSMWCRKTESLSLQSAWPSGCRRCGFELLIASACDSVQHILCYFPSIEPIFLNRFWTSIFCTLKLTIFCFMFLFCVCVLLISSYLLMTGCKIVQIKTNTFGRSNDNSSKYLLHLLPPDVAKGLDVTCRQAWECKCCMTIAVPSVV